MAKKRKVKTFSFQGFDNRHYRLTEQYTAAVDALFSRAIKEISDVAAKENYNPEKPFSFDDYPKTKKHAQKIINGLASNITSVIANGSRKQWLYACQKNDEFVASIMDTSKLSKARLNKMQDRNLDALQTFQKRKVDGMNLSRRVWKYVGQYKDQIEQGLDAGLGEGRSAQQLSRDLRQNLQDPDRLFRRVRDKRGNLQLSKNAKAFHPGRGVYRSSAKNAMRLTRSEINMAYREADWLRWQQLDFVVGFEVRVSNRHEAWLKKVKFKGVEICDQLKGKYPKTFKFKGWHPQCLCHVVPILQDEETFDEQELSDLKSALYGTEYKKYTAKNAVTDVPRGFKDWVAENTEKQANWGSTPYFVRDNFVNGTLADGLKFGTSATTTVFTGYMPPSFSPQQQQAWIDNHREVEKQLNIVQGKEMTFDEANELKGNINYGKGEEYSINCQSCVVANELRRRGFDVTAYGNTGKKGSVPHTLSTNTELAWVDPKTGEKPKKQLAGGYKGIGSYGRIKYKTIKEMEMELVSLTKETGRYHIDWAWKGSKSGHIITVEKLPNGKYNFYDPQNGKKVIWNELKKEIRLRHGIYVLRVDELSINVEIIDKVVKK